MIVYKIPNGNINSINGLVGYVTLDETIECYIDYDVDGNIKSINGLVGDIILSDKNIGD